MERAKKKIYTEQVLSGPTAFPTNAISRCKAYVQNLTGCISLWICHSGTVSKIVFWQTPLDFVWRPSLSCEWMMFFFIWDLVQPVEVDDFFKIVWKNTTLQSYKITHLRSSFRGLLPNLLCFQRDVLLGCTATIELYLRNYDDQNNANKFYLPHHKLISYFLLFQQKFLVLWWQKCMC